MQTLLKKLVLDKMIYDTAEVGFEHGAFDISSRIFTTALGPYQ